MVIRRSRCGNQLERASNNISPVTTIRKKTTLSVTPKGSEGKTGGFRVSLETSTLISNLQLYVPILSP